MIGSLANLSLSDSGHEEAPFRQAQAKGTRWSMSILEESKKTEPEYGSFHRPLITRQPSLDFVVDPVDSSNKSSWRVLRQSPSSSIQPAKTLLEYSLGELNSGELPVLGAFCPLGSRPPASRHAVIESYAYSKDWKYRDISCFYSF